MSSTPTKCPHGQIKRRSYLKLSHHRRTYRRKNGKIVHSAKVKTTRVKSRCIKDRGLKGKSPRNIPSLKKGLLSKYNYHLNLPQNQRRRALDNALKENDVIKLIKRVVVLSTFFKNTMPEYSKRAMEDYLWLIDIKNKSRNKSSNKILYKSHSKIRSLSRNRNHSLSRNRNRSLSRNRNRSLSRNRNRSLTRNRNRSMTSYKSPSRSMSRNRNRSMTRYKSPNRTRNRNRSMTRYKSPRLSLNKNRSMTLNMNYDNTPMGANISRSNSKPRVMERVYVGTYY